MAPIRCCFDQTAVWHSDAAKGPSTPSFNHLVGGDKELIRQREPKHPDGLAVNDQLELRGLYDRQVCGFRTSKNAADISPNLTISFRDAAAVAHESACFDKIAQGICRGESIVRRQKGELNTAGHEEGIWADEQG